MVDNSGYIPISRRRRKSYDSRSGNVCKCYGSVGNGGGDILTLISTNGPSVTRARATGKVGKGIVNKAIKRAARSVDNVYRDGGIALCLECRSVESEAHTRSGRLDVLSAASAPISTNDTNISAAIKPRGLPSRIIEAMN